MRFDSRTARVMKQAARGPAAIALRQQRMVRPTQTGVDVSSGVVQGTLGGPGLMGTARSRAALAGARLVGGGVGSTSMGAARLVSAGIDSGPLALRGLFARPGDTGLYRSMRDHSAFAGFGAVDTGAIAAAGAAAGAKYGATAGGSYLASAVGAGSVAGPIGAAVGLIVGIAVSEILHKNYLNVPQINQLQDSQVKIFDQYKAIQGRVAGRAIGYDVMKALWKGAQNRGYFANGGGGGRQCFHEGCLKYPGRGDWIDSDYSMSGGAPYQWGGVFRRWVAGRQAGAAGVQPNIAPRAVVVAPTMRMVQRATALRGLGAFGDPGTVSDAVSFVDNYYIPAQRPGSWSYPTNTFEHNMLYDLADAFLAEQPGVTTTPYVAIAPTPQPAAPVTTPAPSQVAPPSQTQVNVSYPGYTYIGTDSLGHALYLANADGSKINQNIPIYTPVGGVMTPTGQTYYNAATSPDAPATYPAPQPGNTYPLVPVQTPSGTTVYQANPNAVQAAPPAAAPGAINWGAILALGAGAITLFR